MRWCCLRRRPSGSRSAKGAVLQASLSRQYQARHERVRLDLRVVDVASERAFTRPAVFASLEVLMAAEAFRDGRAVPGLGWSGDPPLAEERVFPSALCPDHLRCHRARLGAHERAARQDPAAEIDRARSQSRLLFWVIAAAGMTGLFPVARRELGTTDRKPRASVLRLLGFRGGREEVQRHEKQMDRRREVAANMRLMTCSRSRYTNRAELPEDRGEERVEAPVSDPRRNRSG